jgi:hypothetical protein
MFSNDMIIYVETPKESTRKASRSEFNMVESYMINIKDSLVSSIW